MIRHDNVDHTLRQAGDERTAIRFGTQGRRHLEEGPVVANVAFVECEMVDADGAGDSEPLCLRLADRLNRFGA